MDINFPSTGGSTTMKYGYSDRIDAVPDCDWVTVTDVIKQVGVGVIQIDVAENQSVSGRSCVIEFTMGDETCSSVRIVQGKGPEPCDCNKLILPRTLFSAPSTGGTVNVPYELSCGGSVTVEKISDCDTLTVGTPSSSTIPSTGGTVNVPFTYTGNDNDVTVQLIQ